MKTFKRKSNKTSKYSSAEKKYYYMGKGVGLTGNLLDEGCTTFKNGLSKREQSSFDNGFYSGYNSFRNKSGQNRL